MSPLQSMCFFPWLQQQGLYFADSFVLSLNTLLLLLSFGVLKNWTQHTHTHTPARTHSPLSWEHHREHSSCVCRLRRRRSGWRSPGLRTCPAPGSSLWPAREPDRWASPAGSFPSPLAVTERMTVWRQNVKEATCVWPPVNYFQKFLFVLIRTLSQCCEATE